MRNKLFLASHAELREAFSLVVPSVVGVTVTVTVTVAAALLLSRDRCMAPGHARSFVPCRGVGCCDGPANVRRGGAVVAVAGFSAVVMHYQGTGGFFFSQGGFGDDSCQEAPSTATDAQQKAFAVVPR